jgi:hypothetical protein
VLAALAAAYVSDAQVAKAALTAASDEAQAAEAALMAAEERMATHGPTPTELRAEAAEAERLASENGDPVKSLAVKVTMCRRWSMFLTKHGIEYGYDEPTGPTIDLAVHFLTHGFNERVYEYSATGERGMGDSWGALQVRLRRWGAG